MAIIARDPCKGRLHRGRGPFQKLQVNVAAAYQRACDIVARVAAPCIQQNAADYGIVKAEGLRGIDDLKQVRDGVRSLNDQTGRGVLGFRPLSGFSLIETEGPVARRFIRVRIEVAYSNSISKSLASICAPGVT